jgi:hypothetical protein
MQCEKCKRITESGSDYQFYYGKLIDYEHTGMLSGPVERQKATYKIEGIKKVPLCHWCVAEPLIKDEYFASIGGVIFLSIILALLAFVIKLPLLVFIILFGIGLIFLISRLSAFFNYRKLCRVTKNGNDEQIKLVLTIFKQEDIDEQGDSLAYKNSESFLKNYISWTRKRYKEDFRKSSNGSI